MSNATLAVAISLAIADDSKAASPETAAFNLGLRTPAIEGAASRYPRLGRSARRVLRGKK